MIDKKKKKILKSVDFSPAIKHDLKNIIYTKNNEESYVTIIERNPQICKFLTCNQTQSEQFLMTQQKNKNENG